MPPRAGSAALRAAPRPECGIRPVCPAGAPLPPGRRRGLCALGPIGRGRGPTGPGQL